MAISTKTGDKQETSTGSGQRVSKASARVQVIGAADELASLLGVAKAELAEVARAELRPIIHRIQNLLFVVLAEVADPAKLKAKRVIGVADVAFLEDVGRAIEPGLPPIKNFIVYGEARGSAYLDYARAVARRLEREMVAAGDEVGPTPEMLRFLNRLSDTLYLLARRHDCLIGAEFVWVSYE